MSAGSSSLAQPKAIPKVKSALGTSSATAGDTGMGDTGMGPVAQRTVSAANVADEDDASAVLLVHPTPPIRQSTAGADGVSINEPDEPAQPTPVPEEIRSSGGAAASSDKEAAAAKARAALTKMVGAAPPANARTVPSFKAVVDTVIEERQKASPKAPIKIGFADAAQEAMRKKKAKRQAAERAAAFDSIAAAAKAADAETMAAEAAARAAALRKNPWAAVGTPTIERKVGSRVSPPP